MKADRINGAITERVWRSIRLIAIEAESSPTIAHRFLEENSILPSSFRSTRALHGCPLPRRTGTLDRAQRLLHEGKWRESLEAVRDLQALGPLSAQWEGRARNAYWPMPFAKSCRITLTNEGRRPVDHVYYHVDWSKVPALPPDTLYFHARYKQELPAPAAKNVYTFLDVKGRGFYAGTVLNVIQPEAVRTALRKVLNRVPPRGAPLALLIPDPVVRVFILPFDTLPRRADEALPLLRWRLKKSVPFDVDETVVSWMRQTGKEGALEVVTAVARQRIVREYEDLVEPLDVKSRVILSSTLTALPLLSDSGSTLLVPNVSTRMLTGSATPMA